MKLQPPQFIWKQPQILGELPQPRYGHSAITYQNSMIIFGGEKNDTSETLCDVHLLDLESWTWTQPQVSGNIPANRSFHTAVLYEDKMLVWGGYETSQDGGYIFSDVALHILNLKTWQWSEIIPQGTPPDARCHHSAVIFQDKLFIDGGSYDIYTARDELHILDLTKMQWLNISPEKSSSAALAGLKIRGNTLVKFLGDAAYGGFCLDIFTLEIPDLENENISNFQWQQAQVEGIENYTYNILFPDDDEDDYDEYEEYDDENAIPWRTIHGYGEFADHLVLFAGMSPGNGISHVTIGDVVLLNMPDISAANSGTYTYTVPEIAGKFPPPRFGHSTIQFNHQMIVYGGLWIDTSAGNNSFDNDVYILEIN